MKNKMKVLLSLSFVMGLAACGGENPDLQARVLVRKPVTQEGDKVQSESVPKVDILFVVDNSGSMQKYQDKMAQNVSLFANEFFDNTRIDYRIGVVPIYDSKYLNDQTVYVPSGKRKMNPLGELVALKGMDPSDQSNKLYITRDTVNPKEVLKQTVVLGTQWGPEAEESFSPVLAIATPEKNKLNQNFYDPNAYLAVIFLTDADDVTDMSGSDFYQKLKDLKGGDGSKILIAAAIPRTCPSADGSGPTQSFPTLLRASGGITADLCTDQFGAQLAKFGKYLVRQVTGQKIHLNFRPDASTLIVAHDVPGSDIDENSANRLKPGEYNYDPVNNNIIIDPHYRMPPDHVIIVKAIPVDDVAVQNGRVQEL